MFCSIEKIKLKKTEPQIMVEKTDEKDIYANNKIIILFQRR